MSSHPFMVIRPSGVESMQQDPTQARKAIEMIDVRLTSKPITFLQHKVFNTWIAFAQSTTNAADTKVFEFPLSDVMEVCRFNSNNVAHFIEAAYGIYELSVEYGSLARTGTATLHDALPSKPKRGRRRVADTERLEATRLISSIVIDSARNLLRVEFPEDVRKEILRPDFYRTIDLAIQARFSSRAGLSLYEYVLRYAADKSTPWLEWERYSMLLSGSDQPHRTFREFSKMLKRAMEQVNAFHPTHDVHAEFTKHGRALRNMRLVIGIKLQGQLLQEGELPPKAIMDGLISFGLREDEAKAIAQTYPVDYLAAQIAYVRRRINDPARKALHSAVAYLRACISGNYADYRMNAATTATKRETHPLLISTIPTSKTPQREEIKTQPNVQKKADTEIEQYSRLPEDQKAALAKQFYEQANDPVRKALERDGLGSMLAGTAFAMWLRDGRHVT